MDIQEFETTPKVVQAVLVTEENALEVAEWCGGYVANFNERKGKRISTPFGVFFSGDWVVCNEVGRFSFLTDESFQDRYRPVQLKQLVHKDARTGEFVSEEYAAAHPATTFSTSV